MQVFIVGAPRSGTTRLKTAIADAIEVPRTAEGHFYPIACDLDAALDGYLDRWRERAGPKTMVRSVDRDGLRSGIHAAVRAAFETAVGTDFVEKTPGAAAIRALPMVTEQWPDAKIVFARRRGIENVISALWKFPDLSFEAACRDWTEAMAAWRGLDPAIRARSLEVDQGTMARQPDAVAAEVGGYLGFGAARILVLAEAFSQRAHPRTNRRVSSMAELQAAPLALSASPWTEAQRAAFVDICGEMMRAFGYDLDG